MKNLAVFVFVVMAVTLAGCSTSEITLGDKRTEDVKVLKNIFLGQIDYYRDQIEDLRFSDQPNDSLIARYLSKIDLLENQIEDLLVRNIGNDQQRFIKLRSNNPEEVANAYALVKYADAMTRDTTAVRGAKQTLIGNVENASYGKVHVRVSGPVNFVREYTLGMRSKSPDFDLPCPGQYTATFTNGYDFRTVTKNVGFNAQYFDGDKSYNFKATLLP